MDQPRSYSPNHNLGRRFSIRSYYTVQRSQGAHRSQSRKLAKEKKMSGALPVDPMDIDSGLSPQHQTSNIKHMGTFLEDDKVEEQFEIVNHETLGSVSPYLHPNDPLEPHRNLNNSPQKGLETDDAKATKGATDTIQDIGKTIPVDNVEKTTIQKSQIEEIDNHDLQSQLQQLRSEYERQMSVLSSKVTNLESSKLRQPSNFESQESGGNNLISNEASKAYEERILVLEKTGKEMEQQIHELLNVQEPSLKYQSELEKRLRAAINQIEKEKRTREENDLNLRSEVMTIRGAYQKEKERAQKLMKTMAEMQSADPFKIDNTSIISSARELRYDIKNWARAQRPVPSLPAQGLLSTYANRALGGKEKGPNYEFLKDVTPVFHDYTESPQDFKWLLQAYVWKRIVEMIFYEDLWAGIRKALDDEEVEYKLLQGYRHMKSNLTPNDVNNQEYIAQFHDWRSTSARILEQRISTERRKRTVEWIRDEILRPLCKAAEPMEQEIHNVEDLEAIIESAMRLGASIAQQKAFFTFEFLAVAAFGKMEFNPKQMTDPYPPDSHDSRTHSRTVWLNLAPRLIKYGTSEGTNFDTCTQLLEGEVETRIAPRKFAVRRQAVN